MAQRSQFLALLGQSGWSQAELAPDSGMARALLTREAGRVVIEIREGESLLCRLCGSGSGAREVVSSLRAEEGAYVDMEGAEAAWTLSMEALFGMRARAVSVGGKSAAAPRMEGTIKIKQARPAQGGDPSGGAP